MDTEFIKEMAESINNVVLATAKPYQEQIRKVQAKNKRLKEALDYATNFIDGYGAARIKEGLGRNGMDAVLEEIEKIVNPTNICPICGDEKPIDDLHRNCGK